MADYSRHKKKTPKKVRLAVNKCTSCGHNIGVGVMDCEYACAGVTEVKDEGRIVISCADYQQGEEQPR